MARTQAAQKNAASLMESILGRSTRLRGQVRGDGNLQVEGTIEGNIELGGDLSVEEGASVVGDIQATSVQVSGVVNGNISSESVVVNGSAKLEGTITSDHVSVEEGALLLGRIESAFDMPAGLAR